jgi:uncharacterized protein
MAVYRDSRADRLATALDDFIRSSPDVEAAAVVSFDGLTMASALPDDLEEDRLGAMSAALLSLGEQAALGLGRGQLNQVFVEGEHGFVFLMSARDQAVLAAIARRTAKIGFMLFEMRRAADSIGTILTPEEEPEAVAGEFAGLGDLHAPASVAVNGAAPQQGVGEPDPDLSGADPVGDPRDAEPAAEGPRQDHSGADLSGANLSGADLAGADLHDADLHDADVPGRDLAGHDDASPAPSPWAVPAPPPGSGGWHEEEPSPLFPSHGRDEPPQSASDAAWRN